jgi:hypothetical protein
VTLIGRALVVVLAAGPRGGVDYPWLILVYVVVVGFVWYCWATLAGRLGYDWPGFIGLGMLVPIINFFVLLFLVFSESPNEQKLRGVRRRERHPGQRPTVEEQPRGELLGPPEPPPTKCPACGAAITLEQARCPDCEIVLR